MPPKFVITGRGGTGHVRQSHGTREGGLALCGFDKAVLSPRGLGAAEKEESSQVPQLEGSRRTERVAHPEGPRQPGGCTSSCPLGPRAVASSLPLCPFSSWHRAELKIC